MSKGPGRWQRAILVALSEPDNPALRFASVAMIVGANTLSERTALRRALNRLVTLGTLGRRVGKRMYGGPREIVWFIAPTEIGVARTGHALRAAMAAFDEKRY